MTFFRHLILAIPDESEPHLRYFINKAYFTTSLIRIFDRWKKSMTRNNIFKFDEKFPVTKCLVQ